VTKLPTLFDKFLSNINPDEQAVEYAQKAHSFVRKNLANDDKFSPYIEGSFLYGSYKRRTAVGDIKDVDIVVLTNFDIKHTDNTPDRVLRKLKAALTRCYDDAENPEYQRRSIRVNDPLPEHKDAALTLDIIPAVVITTDEAVLLVPDREQKKWIRSHPKGHLNHTIDLNAEDYSNGWFVPLVKAMKWWWKYQCDIRQPKEKRPKPKGFWIECLTGETFDPEKASLAEHFITVLETVSATYSNPTTVPELYDPGISKEKIKTSMTLKEFSLFMDAVNDSLEVSKKALKEEDATLSAKLWREVFGDQFPISVAQKSTELLSPAVKPGMLSFPNHPVHPRKPGGFAK
jgi:predicted nucleotidyltransferase